MGSGNGQFGLLDVLTIMSLVLQVQDHEQGTRQMTTNDLMEELQKQDREYLERIIENQERILAELDWIKKNLPN